MNQVKRRYLFLSPVILMLTVSAGLASDEHPRKIWLLAGQSNMLGYTTMASDLPGELQKPQTNVKYFDGQTWQAIRPNMLAGLAFGPELTFGRDLASALPEVEVLLVKCQAGLGDLYNDWRSPNTGRGPAGPHYKAFMDLVQKAVASQPEAEITGMIWMQGEGDAYDNLTEAQSYQGNLKLLIQSIRTDLKTPDMAFVIGQISESRQWVHRKIVRQAQARIAQTTPHTAMVVTSDLPLSDGMHYTSKGQMELGSRFARQAILLAKARDARTTKEKQGTSDYRAREAQADAPAAAKDRNSDRAKYLPPITDKSLVVWVYPGNLTQRGGSLLTLIDDRERFDAVVFGERSPGKWMAGSAFFHRTPADQSAYPPETADDKTLVQIAIAYKKNVITLFLRQHPADLLPVHAIGRGGH